MKQALLGLFALVLGATAVPASAESGEARPTVVLVHGAFVDGSGWAGVHRLLTKEGFKVIVVQNPTTTLADDVAATRRAIGEAGGKVVLVGHSYGGVVITEAGSDPNVSALVYVAAFAPDAGESVSSIVASAPPGSPPLPLLPPVDGMLLIDRAQFASLFAADLPPDTAAFMADSQQPWGGAAFEGKITHPAWKAKPSWFLVSGNDRIIPPAAQRAMAGRARATIAEVPASHAVYVANPRAVAAIIAQAAVPRTDR